MCIVYRSFPWPSSTLLALFQRWRICYQLAYISAMLFRHFRHFRHALPPLPPSIPKCCVMMCGRKTLNLVWTWVPGFSALYRHAFPPLPPLPPRPFVFLSHTLQEVWNLCYNWGAYGQGNGRTHQEEAMARLNEQELRRLIQGR